MTPEPEHDPTEWESVSRSTTQPTPAPQPVHYNSARHGSHVEESPELLRWRADLLMDEMMMGGVDVSAADGNRTFSGVDAPMVQRPPSSTSQSPANGNSHSDKNGYTTSPQTNGSHSNGHPNNGAHTNGQNSLNGHSNGGQSNGYYRPGEPHRPAEPNGGHPSPSSSSHSHHDTPHTGEPRKFGAYPNDGRPNERNDSERNQYDSHDSHGKEAYHGESHNGQPHRNEPYSGAPQQGEVNHPESYQSKSQYGEPHREGGYSADGYHGDGRQGDTSFDSGRERGYDDGQHSVYGANNYAPAPPTNGAGSNNGAPAAPLSATPKRTVANEPAPSPDQPSNLRTTSESTPATRPPLPPIEPVRQPPTPARPAAPPPDEHTQWATGADKWEYQDFAANAQEQEDDALFGGYPPANRSVTQDSAVRSDSTQYVSAMSVMAVNKKRSTLLPRSTELDIDNLHREISDLHAEIAALLPVGNETSERARHLLDKAYSILQSDPTRSAEVEYYMQQVRTIVQRLHQARQWSDLYRQRLHLYLWGWLGLSAMMLIATFLFQNEMETALMWLGGLDADSWLVANWTTFIATAFSGALGGAIGALYTMRAHARGEHSFFDRKYGLRGLILPFMGLIVGAVGYLFFGLLFGLVGIDPSESLTAAIMPMVAAFAFGFSQESIYGTRGVARKIANSLDYVFIVTASCV